MDISLNTTKIDWVENLPPLHILSKKEKTMELKMNKEDVVKASLTIYERDILELADEMASAMSDLNAHNYKNFVDARDKFRDKLKSMCEHAVSSQQKIERMKKVIADL